MTLINKYSIRSSCGNLVDVDIYQSVNITVDPILLGKVKKRQINNFKCPKCGEESELAHHFLFVDMKKKLWIWCYPENDRQNRAAIEKEITKGNNIMSDIIGHAPLLVFGYGELFEKINHE